MDPTGSVRLSGVSLPWGQEDRGCLSFNFLIGKMWYIVYVAANVSLEEEGEISAQDPNVQSSLFSPSKLIPYSKQRIQCVCKTDSTCLS